MLSAACGDGDESAEDPTEVLATAAANLDATTGVALELTAEEFPDGLDGLVGATGVGTHAPAFEGTVDLLVNELSLEVPVVAVDGLVYAKLPFTVDYSEVDPAEYGAPNPANLMDPETGISTWLTAVEDVEAGDAVRDGEAVLTPYSGSLPGEAVARTIPSADTDATFAVTFSVDDEGLLRTVDATGPFYGEQGDVDYVVTLTDYGVDTDITQP